MDVLINSMVGILSWCICIHHFIHINYITTLLAWGFWASQVATTGFSVEFLDHDISAWPPDGLRSSIRPVNSAKMTESKINSGQQGADELSWWAYSVCVFIQQCQESNTDPASMGRRQWKLCIWIFAWSVLYVLLPLADFNLFLLFEINYNCACTDFRVFCECL